ncbi:hypothetical protein SOASR029_38210 [Budvicia aquatica]|nr:hypothetical protein SOASR029_38210 [Budvicia aquatica]
MFPGCIASYVPLYHVTWHAYFEYEDVVRVVNNHYRVTRQSGWPGSNCILLNAGLKTGSKTLPVVLIDTNPMETGVSSRPPV